MKTTRDQNKHVVEIGQSRDVSNTSIAYHGVISPILGVDQEILTSILKGVADKNLRRGGRGGGEWGLNLRGNLKLKQGA